MIVHRVSPYIPLMGSMKRRERYEAEQWAKAQQSVPVLMQFRYDGTAGFWRVTFRPRGATIALPRVLHFGNEDKLRELFRRFGSQRMAEDVAALDYAINTGRGNIELMLGEEQLSKLRTAKRPTLQTG